MGRRFIPILLVVVSALAGCSRSAVLFSEQNARAHVSVLAETIGSRPAGTEANGRARAYVIDQLKLYGYEVRVQETDAQRAELGRTAHVSNIIAVRAGRRSEAVGLVSHYDSAPESPGAADDGLGVAVCLEAARVLAARSDRPWTTMILVTDGEESGLMGAAALMTDRNVRETLRAYINVEAAGSDGTAVLFQAGPVNSWLARWWAAVAPHPRGGSFGAEVYRRLPNDTDFTILAKESLPGLNFAAVDDGYTYHTARDMADRLTPIALRTTGENVVAVAMELDRADITARNKWAATFFDVGGVAAMSYSSVAGWVIAVIAIALGIAACIRTWSAAIRLAGGVRFTLSIIWAIAGSAATVGAMIGATWALRAAREVYHPWYAHPDRLFALLVSVGMTTGWGLARIAGLLPARVRAVRHPLFIWTIALPIWLLLAFAAVWLAPGAAYLWTLPLFVASALLLVAPAREFDAMRIASIAILGVAGSLWLRNTVDVLHFATAVFGRLPVVTPVYVYAAIMASAGVMILPPLVAAVTRPVPLGRPALLTIVCLLFIAGATGAAALAPAYTFDRPLRRHVRALQEPGDAGALWEIASVEPGLDLAPGAPGSWTPQTTAAPSSIPWGRYAHPFVFRARGEPLGPAPVEIAAFAIKPGPAAIAVETSVIPKRGGLAISFVLPAGVIPIRSSLPGALRLGRWTAVFIAPPAEGIAWRATFGPADAARLRDLRIAVTDPGFPSGSGWQRLPRWLPQDRAVWSAAATWALVPAALPSLEPVPPLR